MSPEVKIGPSLPAYKLRALARQALEEDLPWGDVTSECLISDDARARGRLVMKEGGVICGFDVALAVFHEFDDSLRFEPLVLDGYRGRLGDAVAQVSGSARSILSAERTALNFIQRMSGIATTTAEYVEAVKGTRASIVDTRKTPPGLRALDKHAVRCGGGANHRFSLSDAVLVKDNHLQVIEGISSGSCLTALRKLRHSVPHTMKIGVEVEALDQLESVLGAEPDIILLDNMSLDDLRKAVERIDGKCITEASGGINLATVRDVALTGVDLISVGALTHSVRALDVSLDMHLLLPGLKKELLGRSLETQRVADR